MASGARRGCARLSSGEVKELLIIMVNPPGHIPGLHHPGSVVPIHHPPGHVPGVHYPGTSIPMGPAGPGRPETEAEREERERRQSEFALQRASLDQSLRLCVELLFENADKVDQYKRKTVMVRKPFWRGGGTNYIEEVVPTGISGVPIGSLVWEGHDRGVSSGVTREGKLFAVNSTTAGRNAIGYRRAYGSYESLFVKLCNQLKSLGVALPDAQQRLAQDLAEDRRASGAQGIEPRTHLLDRLFR